VGPLVLYRWWLWRKHVQPAAGIGKITKTAINDALRRMKKSGITKPELEAYLREILDSKNKTAWRSAQTKRG
jgi:hypothetical protein